MTERKKPETKFLQIALPVELHQRFKGLCGMKGQDMTAISVELIQKWVEENAPAWARNKS